MLKIYPQYNEPSLAIVLNVHANPLLVADTLDSIKKWATDKIVVIVDKKGWQNFTNFKHHDTEIMCGVFHGAGRSPYKNLAIGLSRLYEKWPDQDWYGYIEFDVVFLSSFFKNDLAQFADKGCVAAGFEHRYKPNSTSHWLVREIMSSHTEEEIDCHKMLGAVMFYTNDCVRSLVKADFYEELLERTKDYKGAKFPNFHDYAVEEIIFPSAASIFGPLGNFDKLYRNRTIYPVRFCPTVRLEEISSGTSIIHPSKKLVDPVRLRAKELRKS